MTTPAVFLAGQRADVDDQNAAALIGRVVFKATRTTTQAITTGTVGVAANALSWDQIDLDLLGGWSAGNPTRYTPPVAGWYTFDGGTAFNATATSGTMRGCSWLKNGALLVGGNNRSQCDGAFPNTVIGADARQFAEEFNGTSDYIELAPFQDIGVNLGTATGSLSSNIIVVYGGPSV